MESQNVNHLMYHKLDISVEGEFSHHPIGSVIIYELDKSIKRSSLEQTDCSNILRILSVWSLKKNISYEHHQVNLIRIETLSVIFIWNSSCEAFLTGGKYCLAAWTDCLNFQYLRKIVGHDVKDFPRIYLKFIATYCIDNILGHYHDWMCRYVLLSLIVVLR